MVIKDEKLGKYEIHVSTDNHTVCYHNGVDKKGKDVYTNLYYCSSLGSALNKIVKLLLEDKYSTTTLTEYLDEHKRLSKQILNITN